LSRNFEAISALYYLKDTFDIACSMGASIEIVEVLCNASFDIETVSRYGFVRDGLFAFRNVSPTKTEVVEFGRTAEDWAVAAENFDVVPFLTARASESG
jgi:hypothetical protein